ncbi:MAG TPA: hypothetical protein VGC73_05025, partial [Pyrinomonadaceae bacterium]
MTLSGQSQGVGVMRITAPKAERETDFKVNLNIEIDKKPRMEASDTFKVVPWRKMLKSEFTGQPVGLAVAAPKMALLTTDGFWIATVGEHDFSEDRSYESVEKVEFKRPTATDRPKAWLALAAFNNKFVALRQTNQDDLQVALYTAGGEPDPILPIDLPPDLRPFMNRSGAVFDLAVYGGRAYVVAEGLFRAGTVRRAFSVGFNSATGRAEYRAERLLELLLGYRLLTFDDTLYALNRETGRMLRFGLTTDGKLEAYVAARAVDQRASSMVKDGLLVPAGRVLAVLNPTSVPSLASLDNFGLKNVLRYQSLTPLRDASTVQQDLVYGTQDRWSRCGHGLDVKAGVVAFRAGQSERLWLIESNGDTYTLTVGSEHLFLHDYVDDLPSKPLPPVLDRKRDVKIINNTGMRFVSINDNETCRNNGFTAFSATGPVEMTSPALVDLRAGITETCELRYNGADPATTTLRFLMQRPGGIRNEYFLELTLSGADLSAASTVFKRIAVDRLGSVSIAEVPGTRQEHSSDRIEFSPKPLVDGLTLRIRNVTPYKLWLRSPEATDPRDREKECGNDAIPIRYNTPAFSIYAHGAGELFFDVDFAMPNGMEQTLSDEVQTTKRIRVNSANGETLRTESVSVNDSVASAAYECTLRYKVERGLAGVFIGDGAPTKDGASIYLPRLSPTGVTRSEVTKLRADDLLIEGAITLDGGGIFSPPNSVVVSSDKVLAIFKENYLNPLTHELKSTGRTPIDWHDVITNLKGSPNDGKFYTLGMKQLAQNPPRYSYSYAARSFAQPFEEQMGLDALKGFRPARVPGAPAWVSPNVTSPMDVSAGVAMAICVEGGVFLIDLKSKTVMEVPIDGTGREEAVLIDPIERLVFCAHARPDNNALMISRINATNL